MGLTFWVGDLVGASEVGVNVTGACVVGDEVEVEGLDVGEKQN